MSSTFTLLAGLFYNYPLWAPRPLTLLTATTTLTALALTKRYTSGSTNPTPRDLHGRIILLTGGTSGIGAATALSLASAGAQLILLTHTSPSADPFLQEYIEELRVKSGNSMVYAEQVDLSSFHSVRKFATRWIDNSPPRRLDAVVLCAAIRGLPGSERRETREGVEEAWMVNYLSTFHLLGILSPALRAQPFDRDVRVVFATCSSYIGAPADCIEIPGAPQPLPTKKEKKAKSKKDEEEVFKGIGPAAMDKAKWTPRTAYARSKLALMMFARSYQRHLDSVPRGDKLPNNARVIVVDPGYSRTEGLRRWASRGSVFGLVFYVLTYFWWWLFLKSAEGGAQSVLYALMSQEVAPAPGRQKDEEVRESVERMAKGEGKLGEVTEVVRTKLVKECREVDCARREVGDEKACEDLWRYSDKLVEERETLEMVRLAVERKEREQREKEEKEAAAKREQDAKDLEQKEEIGALVDAIKRGQATENAGKAKGKGKSKKA